MIRHDKITIAATSIAAMISIYLGLFQGNVEVAWFPAILLMLALVLNQYVSKKFEYDDDLDEGESLSIILATGTAIATVSFLSLILHTPIYRRSSSIAALSILDAKLFAALMAVAEEQFFRGFVVNFAYAQTENRGAAAIVGAIIGGVYHIFRYASDPRSLILVIFGFAVFGMIALKERRLSPVILAHVIHNVVYA